MKFLEYLRVLSLNPRFRIERHVEYLRRHVIIEKEPDRKNFSTVYDNFKRTSRKLAYYQWARVVVFVLLYISAVAAIAPTLQPLTAPISQFTSVIGAGVLSLLALLLTRVISTVTLDMVIQHGHLVAIAVKNNDSFEVHPRYKHGLYQEYEE